MTKTEQKIKELTVTKIEQLGYKLYDVLFVKEAGEWYLRFFIRKQDDSKIDLDDCEKVSNGLSDLLDEADPISESYNLEVSSCGMEPHLREQEHYKQAVGKKVQINLFKPQDGKKEFEGILLRVSDDIVELDVGDKATTSIDIKDISSAKIKYNWEELDNE